VTGSSSSSPASLPSLKATVDTLLFAVPLDRFISIADSPGHDRRLDWTSDACSAPVVESKGRSFDFTAACRRHDFGYRNLARIDGGKWWTAATRQLVDSQFRRDMHRDCERRVRTFRLRCLTWMEVFYRAVRTYAGP
jgi:hypothetical protein